MKACNGFLSLAFRIGAGVVSVGLVACSAAPQDGEAFDDMADLEPEEIAALEQAIEASPTVVISQVYADAQNWRATPVYARDFIEIMNRGDHAISLAGWSIQYASATGNGNFGQNAQQLALLPAVTLNPGKYLLIAAKGNTTGLGRPLPTPFVEDTTPIDLSKNGGKIALAKISTSLGCNGGSVPCTAAQLANIVDLVGYGTANLYEGAPAPAPVASGIWRSFNGCWDSNNNSIDFVVQAPAPRTANTAATLCLNFGTTP